MCTMMRDLYVNPARFTKKNERYDTADHRPAGTFHLY